MTGGHLYLAAVIDIFSRFVLSWELSNSLEDDFCITAVGQAIRYGKPLIFNTDQGSQFTSIAFAELLESNKILISMDGKGRAADNIFIERLWHSLKYEDIYLKDYRSGKELYDGIAAYLKFYNYERKRQSLQYRTPAEIFFNAEHVKE